MFSIDIYAYGLTASLGLGIGGWLLSLHRNDLSIADSLWPISFMLMSIVYVLCVPGLGDRGLLVLFLVGVWGSRLASFLLRRDLSRPEDRRYREMRARFGPEFQYHSLYLVFGTQSIVAWIMALPLFLAISIPSPLGAPDYAAVALWLTGLFFEAIGDEQLAEFKRNPSNRDRVLDQGLWRFSRHPNYFGELCIWWAFWLFAFAAGAWWSIVAPLLATYLLIRLSGIPLAEHGIEERRPGYREYARRTSPLIPWPPRHP
jgi:steroid 5-alpha reductase family enzyme